MSIKYTERLAEAGIEPSVGSVGDSYDNALAETINGLYKAEIIHRRALLVKNRDLSGTDFGLQRVAQHEGAGIACGTMLCVGSLGAPAAYSSGINAWGFALADTHVPAPRPQVGWLRYFLMTRLLATCRRVEEAIATIRRERHAGGGTLVFADASGAVAAVEFDGGPPSATIDRRVWRTNHYVCAGADGIPARAGGCVAAGSRARFTFLERMLPARAWGVTSAARLMATHAASREAESAPLCQHRERDGSQTLSCSIYACRSRALVFSDGNPCQERWATYRVAT